MNLKSAVLAKVHSQLLSFKASVVSELSGFCSVLIQLQEVWSADL